MSRVVVDLSALAGKQNVVFRFRLGADEFGVGAVPGTGWWIDDVAFTGLATDCNEPPVAGDDTATTQAGSTVRISVLANDRDPDGDALAVTSATDPARGTVTLNGDGTITYAPDGGFSGTDSFDYTVSDGQYTDTARVTVTVEARPNRAPVANADSATTARNTPVTIAVLANDHDPDGDPITLTGVTQPSSGTASANADGTVTYTPATNSSGTVSFLYSITDGHGATVWGTVTVNVGEPGAPIACFGWKPKDPNTRSTVGFDARCTDDDLTPDDQLAFAWDFDSDGTVDATGMKPQHTYATAGTYTITLRVTDTSGSTDVLRKEIVIRQAK
jgi:hypothetical protein